MLFALTLLACSGGGTESDPVAAITALTGDTASGETLFSSNCASCHGAAGEGVSAPAIAGLDFTDGDISLVLNGEDGMPAFGESLSDQDIADIIAYVGTL
jgi:mono/diheme cytochrome c family protein